MTAWYEPNYRSTLAAVLVRRRMAETLTSAWAWIIIAGICLGGGDP
jgi:hypothetical protein